MKLKCQPEDFRVEELPLASPAGAGRYTYYRLSKRNIGTIEAVEAICRRWNLAGRQVSYGGLKDRHAVTVQYLTVADGPARPITAPNFELEPLGRLAHPYGPQNFRGNRFELVLRDMTEADVVRASAEIPSLSTDGLPNYFDDQRFGSVGYSGQFIAHAWLTGDHERALKLALAEANPFDRSGIKAQKTILRDHWGQWAEAKLGPARTVIHAEHRHLPGRSSHRLSWRVRPATARVSHALFFRLPESPLELDSCPLDRAIDRARPARGDRPESRSLPVPTPAHQRAGAGAQRIAPAIAIVARASAGRTARRGRSSCAQRVSA